MGICKAGRCVIICASPEFSAIKTEDTDYIIACDGGYAHALNAKITPDLILGDFDSYSGEIPANINVMRANVEKNDTDTMLAIKIALDQGYRDFVMLGATGGRLDHQQANLGAAAYIARRGGKCVISAEHSTIHVLKDGKLDLLNLEGQTISVLSFTDISKGVTLRGMKYPLTNAVLESEFPLGVSNIVIENIASVEVTSGILLIIIAGIV